MALYLSAEQKNLKSLFSNDDRYIIPSYQRHYSWTMEECKQLYDDVLEAFESNTDSYFLGNIVLAEGEKDDRPEVVDGQQRLITLWLYLKSLCILQPNNNRLKRMIQVESYEEESTSDYLSKISSDVFEVKDQMQIDEVLMQEVAEVKKLAQPVETLLVADALIGQEACNVAKEFNDKIGITGLVLTRIDGSSRAGAALSMKMISGAPVKILGTGEKIDELEEFHADRIAGRILGQGDVVSLVEKAIENVDKAEAEKMAGKMLKGSFDLNDMLEQMRQIKKLGSIGSIIGMLPGLSKYKSQIEESGMCDNLMKKQEAIILSMTKKERLNPDLIKASRKRRIAQGSGVTVHDVNVLLKSYEQMSGMMKKMGKFGSLSAMSKLFKGNPMGGMPFGGFNKKFPF